MRPLMSTDRVIDEGAAVTQLGYYDLEKTPLIACQLDQRFGYCLYVPRGYQPGDPDTGLAVVVHGTLRTPERYREEFSAFAEEHNCIILCPLFPAGIIESQDLDNYKYLEYHGIRFDHILLSMVDEVARKYELDVSRFLLHGFSGGGHFAHRFLYLHASRLRGVSIGAPGMITMIDPERSWHIGTKGLEDKFGIASTLEEMRAVPVHMVVGADDTDTWEINNTSGPLWMEGADAAGKTRVERLSALRENYRARASRSGSTCCRASPTRATRSSTRCATSSRPPWARGCA